MPLTLQQICMRKLLKDIKNMPPLMKEKIVGQTRKKMWEGIEKQVWANVEYYLPYIIDEMVMQKVNEIQGKSSTFPTFDKKIDPRIIEIARQSAENIGRKLEPVLCDNYMGRMNTQHNSDFDESDGDNY